ncbi:thiolase C-terminal domain-containing protein [Rhizobium sp. BR 315]|uniref:thiolase C-terminal domain-containing protein n=1 Tax=Rhizobiaceae TaxID=82115 RepID=UPI003D3445CF
MATERFPSGSASIVGAFESPRRKAPGVHPYQIHSEVIAGALADAGLTIADVDGFATAASFPSEAGWQLNAVEIAEYVGINPSWVCSTDIGGAAALSHVGNAVAAIKAGLCNTVVVSYASSGRSWPLSASDFNTGQTGPGEFEVPYGVSTISAYALAATRYMHQYGLKSEHLAEIAVQARRYAHLNPEAMYRDLITIDDVLSSPMISSPLHKLDCCVVSDSGGAIVVTSKDRARDTRRGGPSVLGFGEAISHGQMNQMCDMTTTVAEHSGRRAFQTAGLTPEEIHVAQIYDSFTITVALTLEALGFVPKGEVGNFISEGGIAPGGRLPINTDGGGLSSNHAGRRGMFATIEAVRQLRGESPGLQLASPDLCLINGTGGWLSATATLILGGKQ